MNRTEVIRRIAAEEVADMSVAEMQLALMGHIMNDLDEYDEYSGDYFNSDEGLEELAPDVLSADAQKLVARSAAQSAAFLAAIPQLVAQIDQRVADGGCMDDLIKEMELT
mgnify:CR=1 FL=1|jgi:hypothetical protein